MGEKQQKKSHGKIKHSSMFTVCLLICLLAQLYWIVMFVLKRVTNIDKNRKSDSISTTYLSSYFFEMFVFYFTEFVYWLVDYIFSVTYGVVQWLFDIQWDPCLLLWRPIRCERFHWVPIVFSRNLNFHLGKYGLRHQELRLQTHQI